ncbi:MAG: hypothetical protein WAV78_29630, partial [Xanthobacteraceae bacterium]
SPPFHIESATMPIERTLVVSEMAGYDGHHKNELFIACWAVGNRGLRHWSVGLSVSLNRQFCSEPAKLFITSLIALLSV